MIEMNQHFCVICCWPVALDCIIFAGHCHFLVIDIVTHKVSSNHFWYLNANGEKR